MSKMTVIHNRDTGDEDDSLHKLVTQFLEVLERSTRPAEQKPEDDEDNWHHRVFYREDS